MKDEIIITAVQDDHDRDKVKIYREGWLLAALHVDEYETLFGREAYNAMFSEEYGSTKLQITLEVSAYPL